MLIRPMAQYLYQLGIQFVYYPDDCLITGKTKQIVDLGMARLSY